MSNHSFPDDLPANEMNDYLRLYLDETNEQLDSLVEIFLQLEHQSPTPDDLNEAFRLIHSIKGSSALLGLDRITSLTHHLETHFERLRSGKQKINIQTKQNPDTVARIVREMAKLKAQESTAGGGD